MNTQYTPTPEEVSKAFARIYSETYTPDEIEDAIGTGVPQQFFAEQVFTLDDMYGYEL